MTRASTITARLMLFSLAIATAGRIGFAGLASSGPASAAHGSLVNARKNFVTKIVRDLRQDRTAPSPNVPKPWLLVHYNSPAGQLAAYLTSDPKDGKKHPAVVWAHGGFGGIGADDLDKMPDEKIQMRLAAAALPADTVTVSEGVKVALSVEANRSISPLIIDLDPATRKLRMTHAKEQR